MMTVCQADAKALYRSLRDSEIARTNTALARDAPT